MKNLTTKQTLLALSISILLSANYNLAQAIDVYHTRIDDGQTDHVITSRSKIEIKLEESLPYANVTALNISNGSGVKADNIDVSLTADHINKMSEHLNTIVVEKDSHLDLGKNSHVSLTTSVEPSITDGNNVYTSSAILINASSSHLTADHLQIDVNAGKGYGLYQEKGSSVDLGTGSVIDVTVDTKLANYIIGDTKLTSSGGAKVVGNGTTFKAEQLTIKSNNIVLEAQGGANVDLGHGSLMELNGDVGYGILTKHANTLVKAANITLNVTATNAVSAMHADGGSTIDITEDSHLTSESGHGLVATGSNSTINFKGSVDKRNQIVIESNNVSAAAITAGANVINVANTDIEVKSGEGRGLQAQSASTINADNVSIKMTGADALAVRSIGEGSTVNLTGKTEISGNLNAIKNGVIDLHAAQDSEITGKMDIIDDGVINLNLTESSWNITGNSTVSDATLNHANINFVHAIAGEYSTLTADNLFGNSEIHSKVDLVGETGDKLVVKGAVNGNHKLFIENNGSAQTDGNEHVVVAELGENQNNITLGQKVEAGGYIYDLRIIDSMEEASPKQYRDLDIASVDSSEPADLPIKLELYATKKQSSSAKATTSFLNIGYLTNYIENQTLLQRLGDLRNNATGNSGAWVKGFAGKLYAFSGKAFDGFDLTYSGLQVGVDTDIGVEQGQFLVGFMAGYTHTNPYYGQGSGGGKNYSLGYYATYLADSGFYVDSVLKFNHMKNQFTVKDTAGDLVKGTGKTSGISLSAEVGQRFWFGVNQDGFYLEPQAQLSYGYQSGNTVKASNGLKVGLSHYNSLLGRASLIAGYQLDNINLYAKAGIVREMNAKTNYQFNNVGSEHFSLKSNWFDTGIGINWNFLNSHNIYAEFDYANGQNFDKQQFNLGYRFTF